MSNYGRYKSRPLELVSRSGGRDYNKEEEEAEAGHSKNHHHVEHSQRTRPIYMQDNTKKNKVLHISEDSFECKNIEREERILK